MPLSKKWRSMDLFGSLENLSMKHHHPFRSRLSSLSSGSKEPKDIKEESPRKDEVVEPGSNCIQRCVIIQRDEKGYGLTVSGDNPVFVQSVKSEGAAARAGVQEGDKIVKVNGSLVLNRNHLDVVKLIKSGSYVVLTLVGKPPSSSSGASPASSSGGTSQLASTQRDVSQRDSTPSSNRVTAPKPVDPEKDRELWQQKVHYLRAMYETAKDDFEKLQRTYVKSPTERLHSQLIEKEKTLKTLENQLKALTGSAEPTSDLDPLSMESSTSPSWRKGAAGNSKHVKQASVPASLFKSAGAESRAVAVARSKSDVTSKRPPGSGVAAYMASQRMHRADSEASSFPNPISDSDSPNTSPCGSPTPNHPENTSSMDVDEHLGPRVDAHPGRHIISPEEDDFNSDDEPTTDHGPFQDIILLEKKPAHLAVFLHYLISNSDPSPVFFYIVSDVFSRAQGNAKELKKWAYEIYSTFLAVNAPLRVELEDQHINQIDTTLTTSSTKDKQDNEAALRGVFEQARCAIRMEIQDLLQDFRSKKELGLGNIYGAHELKDNMDRSSEMRTIEKVLSPHLENIMGKEESRRSDKEQATIWALATVFRQLGVSKLHSGVIDRVQSFVMKDKKSIKFPGTRFNRSKTHKGHQFNAQHYYMATFCYQCKGLIWGVGFQGFQCSSCEINVHKQCLEDVAECGGKKKGKRPSSMLPIVPSSRKPSNSSLQSVGPVSTSSEGSRESLAAAIGVGQGDLNITTQPYPKEIDSELAGTVNEHSVKSIVDRYEGSGDRKTRSSPPGQDTPDSATALIQKKGTDLGRSESMKGRGEKGDRPARRAKSDVDMDNAAFNTLNQSGSSSASSISNRGIDSPGNSYEAVSELAEDSDMDVESELPPLKEVLGDEVLRKLKPKEKKRQEVINEFFHTEFCHMRNLKILQRVFYRPLVDIMGNRTLAELLFPNIDKMIQLHQMLHTEMKNRRKENAVVQEVGDILLKRFDGHAGEDFKEGCARFCANQSHALDVLRKSQRKDYKLAQFLNEAESNPRCRRLQLKDLLPTQMQRLTKYPLLIENLLKYTQQNSDEHRNLEMAHLCSKKILEHVNQAIREHENKLRLEDLQRRMDKRPVESINDSSLEDIKGLDLTKGRLAHDGPLMWRLRSHRLLEVHVVLLEDMMVILQKSDDRLILKCHSTNQSSPDKFTHTPVLRLQNLLARNVATDKKSFFVVNTSETGPQIYELIANTQDERKKWCRLINDFAEKMKSGTKGARSFGYSPGMPKVSPPTNSMTHTGQAEEITVVRDTIKRETPRQSSPIMEPPSESESGDAEDVPSSTAQSGLLTAQPSIVPVHDNLIQPSELSVSDPIIAMAQPVRAPLERLRHLDEQIRVARHEREAVLADLGPEDYFQYQMTEPWGSEGDLPGSEMEMEEKLAMEILDHSKELCKLLSSTETSPDPSPPRDTSESGAARAEDPKSPGGGSGAIPMSQLKDMASEMQQIIKNLMSVVGSNREERDRLRQELVIAQEKISRLREIQRSVTSGELPLSPSSLQGGVPFAGLGGEGLLGASVEVGQGDDKRSSLVGVSDDDGDDSNASTATTETTSEQALESMTGDKLEDRPSTPDQSSEKLEAGNTSAGFTPTMGLQPGDEDKGIDKSDESDSDTCKAGGPGGVSHGLTEQLDSFSSFTSESTLLACSVMTTDLDEGTASPEPPHHARDDNEDDNGDEDAPKPSTTTDCDLDPQEPGHAAAETDQSALEGKECSGAEAFEAGEDGSQGEDVPTAEGAGMDRDAESSHTTDLDSSDHTEPVEI